MPAQRSVKEYLADLRVSRPVSTAAHNVLVSQGCHPYVKTIYIGYEIDGEMVAALYGHADHAEVAIAVPEDHEHPLLIDASHLTWRTLPLAAILRTQSDVDGFAPLAALACSRVREASHDVVRNNDFFIEARRTRRR